jgi:maleylacetoacetate isomerase
MSQTPRLFQSTTSSASWRVRIALALKQVQYETVWVDLHKGEHLADEYAGVSPMQQVPCLEIDGQRLVQSVAIIEYLDETRPEPPLLPGDPVRRAAVRTLTEILNSVIQPMHNLAVRERLREQFGASESDVQAWCRYWIERRFAGLDRALAAHCGRFSVGDALTMADVFLFPQVGTSGRFDVDLAEFPAVSAVVNNLRELPPFRDSYAPRD